MILPIGGVALGRVCACTLGSWLILFVFHLAIVHLKLSQYSQPWAQSAGPAMAGAAFKFSCVWLFLCFVRLLEWEKDLSHTEQTKCFSPVHVIRWDFTFLDWEKDLWQEEQVKGLSTLSVLWWVFRLPDTEKTGHTGDRKKVSFESWRHVTRKRTLCTWSRSKVIVSSWPVPPPSLSSQNY